jgi:hypothetical protein
LKEPEHLIWVGDGPLLEYYQGHFDAVFLALHPFVRIESMHPLQCQSGTIVIDRSEIPEDVDLLEYSDRLGHERGATAQFDWAETVRSMKSQGIAISWREVATAIGFDDLRRMDRALRTNILGLKREFEDADAADQLVAHCMQAGIFLPTAGDFQPVHQRRLGELFVRTGTEQVMLGDEFGEETNLGPLSSLTDSAPWPADLEGMPKWPLRRIYHPDASLLAVVPWDHFFMVLAMTDERKAQVCPESLFEGFWADSETTTAWFVDPMRPIVGPR